MRSPALQRIIGPLATTKEKPVQQQRPSTAKNKKETIILLNK